MGKNIVAARSTGTLALNRASLLNAALAETDQERELLSLYGQLQPSLKTLLFQVMECMREGRRPFSRWVRGMDSDALALVAEDDNGRILEWVDLDIRDLPRRPDLLARLGPDAIARLLADAAEASSCKVN
ncbi:hypothetical protein [Luteibacter sp. E-22]|jgi:hypothetical protein|uniref:hypothetical protein n=1 Tax=Luteibacter sp. E-22 TaxID=3404050 RepID=UPI003CFA4A02